MHDLLERSGVGVEPTHRWATPVSPFGVASGVIEPPDQVVRLKIPVRIVQVPLPSRDQTTRKGVTMSTIREACSACFRTWRDAKRPSSSRLSGTLTALHP
jgi:hypothetical protein